MGDLNVFELSATEKVLIKLVQQEAFHSEYPKTLKSVSEFNDELNLFRIKSKVNATSYEKDFIYPILLPRNYKIVDYLIHETRLNMSYVGLHILISKIRETFFLSC